MDIRIEYSLSDAEKARIIRYYLQVMSTKKELAKLLKKHNVDGRSKMVNNFGQSMYRYDPSDGQYKYSYGPDYSEEGQLEVAKLILDNNLLDFEKILESFIKKYSTNPFWRLNNMVHTAEIPPERLRVTITKRFPEENTNELPIDSTEDLEEI